MPSYSLHFSVVLHWRQFADAVRGVGLPFAGFCFAGQEIDFHCPLVDGHGVCFDDQVPSGPSHPITVSSTGMLSGSVPALYPYPVRRAPILSPRRYPLSLCLFDVDDVR